MAAYAYPQMDALYLSDGTYNKIHQCPRKVELYKFIGHGNFQYEDTLDTGSGNALHRGWQTFMHTHDKELAIWTMMKNYPAKYCKSAFQPKSLEACYSALEEMMNNAYFGSRYELAYIRTPYHADPQPAIEVPFRITFKNASILADRHVPIYWDGFIDAILWDTLEQRFIVVDVKTTGKQRNDYTTMFSRDEQCLPYAYVLEKATGQPASMLDVIYFVVYVDHLNPRALPYRFIKTQNDIEHWAFSVAMDINSLKMMASIGMFPKRGKACDTWNACAYDFVCDYNDKDSIADMLAMKFGKRDDSRRKDTEFKPWFSLGLEIGGI